MSTLVMSHGLPTPPEHLRVGVGPFADAELFRESGRRTVQSIVELCGIEPDAQVLEAGCGCGRLARAFAAYLGPQGRYEGFDVAAEMVDWCRQELEHRLANFRFRLAGEVRAGSYNPSGSTDAAAFKFPYPDRDFDLVIFASVFTHMLPPGIENYVAETARVLRPGGRSFMTVLLFDDAAARAVETRSTIFDFRHRFGPCLAFDRDHPEEGVACEEDWFLGLLARAGLGVETVRRGDWRDVHSYAVSHDYVVARRGAT